MKEIGRKTPKLEKENSTVLKGTLSTTGNLREICSTVAVLLPKTRSNTKEISNTICSMAKES